jgi:Predicted metal-dependent hydrolase
MFDALKNGILTGHKVIDLSVTLNNNPHTDPPPLRPKIKYTDHQEGLGSLLSMFPGLKAEDLPDAEGWAAEDLEITTHSGTHMDAPWHYASTTDGGKPAWGIDQLPLEWCFQRGVKLDFRHLPDGYVVSAKDIQEELARIGHELQPLDIVLVNTRAGAIYGEPEYLSAGVGIGREGTLFYLIRACAWLALTRGVGMRPLVIRLNGFRKKKTLLLFGKVIKLVGTSATGKWKNSLILRHYLPMAFWCLVSPTRLKKRLQDL